jgi:hypothetical protein
MNPDDKPQRQLDKSFSLTRHEQSWEAPPPDDKKPVDPGSPRCLACGRYHGGVNAALNCLRRGILERDKEIAALRARCGTSVDKR